MSRTIKSLRNIKYSIGAQFLMLLTNFVTRTVFVNTLGAEYLGINGLFSNILSFLALAELGIGSAITYSLYKPLNENDTSKVKAIMDIFRKSYNIIGAFVFVSGMMLMPFLHIFLKEMPNIPNINIIFLMYVANSSFSYFYSYKRSLLIADQKKYIQIAYRSLFHVIKGMFQIVLLLVTKNFMFFLSVQIIITLLENIYVSKIVQNMYPFLTEKGVYVLDRISRDSIIKNTKAMVMHNIGGVVVMGTDNLLISRFVGLIEVGLYSNYLLIINALNQMFSLVFNSLIASIGNLGAAETPEKSRFIFACIDLVGFWIYAYASISLAVLFNPFITMWLGVEYMFDMQVVLLIVLSFYLTGRRKSILTFRAALGLFWYDRYKPIFESITNLGVSILLARYLGISGIILGTIISTVTVCLWIEPRVLFWKGFNSPVNVYFARYGYQFIVMIAAGLATWAVSSIFSESSFLNFVGRAIVSLVVPNIIFLAFFWKTDEFKYLVSIFSFTKNQGKTVSR